MFFSNIFWGGPICELELVSKYCTNIIKGSGNNGALVCNSLNVLPTVYSSENGGFDFYVITRLRTLNRSHVQISLFNSFSTKNETWHVVGFS